MLFNVPQHIEVEDKVAGPFTAKQLLWMFGMGVVLLILWGVLDQVTFIISAIPTVLIFCALAFYKPQGQPLIKFVIWGIGFAFKPKVYVWKRNYIKKNRKKKIDNAIQDNKTASQKERKKEILAENLEDLAKTLDTEGRERSKRMMEIIKQNREKNK